MYKIIDTEKWLRKNIYNWFSSFSNPCYGIDSKIDVSEIYAYSKETDTSFFINFVYIIAETLNSVEAMRLRIVNGEVRLYDVIHPSFTVMTKLGVFENCGVRMTDSYRDFYEAARLETETAKNETAPRDGYNTDSDYDDIYMTSMPWLDYTSMIHPIPDGDVSSVSVPRVCFGKFNDDKILSFNITVSHALVDGKELCDTFNLLQENCNNCRDFFEKN